jgi:hypothetical protein
MSIIVMKAKTPPPVIYRSELLRAAQLEKDLSELRETLFLLRGERERQTKRLSDLLLQGAVIEDDSCEE